MFTPPASTMAGLNFLGSGISAYGQYQAGQQSKATANYNATLADQNAQVVRQSEALTEYQKKKNLEATVGEGMARYASAGVNVNEGSPIDVMTDTLSKGYLDIAISKFNDELAARGYESQAAESRYTGAQAAKENSLKAGLTLLQGASTFASKQTATDTKVTATSPD